MLGAGTAPGPGETCRASARFPSPHCTQDPAQQADVPRPRRGLGRIATQRRFRAIKGILQQRIVQRAKHKRPRDPGAASCFHFQHMPESGFSAGKGCHLEAMTPVESLWTCESEPQQPPGTVLLYFVPYWPVSADRAYLQRSVEPHRWPLSGPQSIRRR